MTTLAGMTRKTAAAPCARGTRCSGSARPLDLVGEVGVVELRVLVAVPLGHDRAEHDLEAVVVQRALAGQALHLAVLADERRFADAQMQVAAAIDDEAAEERVDLGLIEAVRRLGVGVHADLGARAVAGGRRFGLRGDRGRRGRRGAPLWRIGSDAGLEETGHHAVAHGEAPVGGAVGEGRVTPLVEVHIDVGRRDLLDQRRELRRGDRLLGDGARDAREIELRAVVGLQQQRRRTIGQQRGKETVEMGHEARDSGFGTRGTTGPVVPGPSCRGH